MDSNLKLKPDSDSDSTGINTRKRSIMEFSKSRPMQHVDRRELYTSLETRVAYLHSFLDFSSRMSLSSHGYLEMLTNDARRRH